MAANNERASSIRLQVRVQPRASRNQVAATSGSKSLLVKVTAPPVKGAANRACIELLADALGIRKSALAIVKGHQARDKVIQIAGLSETEVFRRIENL